MRPLFLLGLLVTVIVGLSPAVPSSAAPARTAVQAAEGPPPMEPSKPYAGIFADPAIVRAGRTYYAFGTTTSGRNLPALQSVNLRDWTARRSFTKPPARWITRPDDFNDALLRPPRWAVTTTSGFGTLLGSQWAPSVAKVRGRWLAAVTFPRRFTYPVRRCIGLAVSTNGTPLGPYRMLPGGPLTCGTGANGVIDPDFFVDPRTGRPWLLYKDEGIAGVRQPRLVTRRLTMRGTHWAPGSRQITLMQSRGRGSWESTIVENPSMVRWKGRYWLFFSGNKWLSSRYSTGYAVCAGPAGPCRRPAQDRLLTSGRDVSGPGGADAFIDHHGALRLGYAAYSRGLDGRTGFRTLHVARVGKGRPGTLRVLTRTLRVRPPHQTRLASTGASSSDRDRDGLSDVKDPWPFDASNGRRRVSIPTPPALGKAKPVAGGRTGWRRLPRGYAVRAAAISRKAAHQEVAAQATAKVRKAAVQATYEGVERSAPVTHAATVRLTRQVTSTGEAYGHAVASARTLAAARAAAVRLAQRQADLTALRRARATLRDERVPTVRLMLTTRAQQQAHATATRTVPTIAERAAARRVALDLAKEEYAAQQAAEAEREREESRVVRRRVLAGAGIGGAVLLVGLVVARRRSRG